MTDERTARTVRAFDAYERRFAAARAAQRLRDPVQPADRAEILEAARQVLGVRDEWIPEIAPIAVRDEPFSGYTVSHLTYRSWPHCYGAASLYRPDGGGRRPLVLVCPGHGEEGRLTDCYQRMAQRLALQGAYVLVNDNLGQGARERFGHWDCVAPFYCGISLQGMIVMETLAWVRYLAQQDFVDASRIGACGNSGGGTLTLFLAALCPQLATVSSSGYPSEFGYILQKERCHCACNLLPHYAGRLEMWELFSCFAPRPLMLEQGALDNLIPIDLFRRNARKVQAVYDRMGAGDRLHTVVTPTTHSWTSADRYEIAAFLAQSLGLDAPFAADDDGLGRMTDPAARFVDFPPDAQTTDEIAQQITGISMPAGTQLADVFPPQLDGQPIAPGAVQERLGQSGVLRVLAQFESAF